jgi:ubiquitin C-terminal hydrolase
VCDHVKELYCRHLCSNKLLQHAPVWPAAAFADASYCFVLICLHAGGHYTAHVHQPDGRWLHFNDAQVTAVPEAAVLAERPYLLVYEKQ